MSGIVKLGAPGALRDYTLLQQGEGIAWESGPAHPFAARVNSSSQYDEIDDWNEWIQEDWQTGAKRVDPQEGGFLYAEAETRVPKQVILPPLLQQCDSRTVVGTTADVRYMPSNVAGSIVVGSGSHQRVAAKVTITGTGFDDTPTFAFYARSSVDIKISLYSDSAGVPGTVIDAETVSARIPHKSFEWYERELTNPAHVGAVAFWLVIEPASASDTIEVAYGTSGYDVVAKSHNGSSWSNIASTYLVYTSNQFMVNAGVSRRIVFRFNSETYTAGGSSVFQYDSANEQFDFVNVVGGSGTITSIAIFGPAVYIGKTSGNFRTMNTSEAFADGGSTRNLFLEFGGLLYGTWQNDLYYTDDGSNWTGPFVCGGDDVEIRGLAGLGDSVYVATDKALLRFAPGDVIEEVSRFGAEDSSNGVGMIEYNGRLYIPVGGRVFRFDPSGQLQDIWLNGEDDQVLTTTGSVVHLARMNNWLLAYATDLKVENTPAIWAWQEEGWHFIARVPGNAASAFTAGTFEALYDRENGRLWLTHQRMGPFFLDIDDYTLNPFNSTTYKYMANGWLEQDRFYGGQRSLNKDWESVRIYGDNLSANVNVRVFWQDEDSTDWELLGTATSDGHELRWSDYTTRPQGKWIKLGLLLQTNDGDETPRVRAAVVKFLPKTNQKIQDNITIVLKSSIEMPDGTTDAFTHDQQWAHIKSLIVDRVHPVIYMNPEGVYYETVIASHRRRAVIFAHEGGSNLVKESHISLTLRQINDDEYTP